jgi:uncharacterized protein YcfL
MKKSVFALMAALTFVACGSKQEEAAVVEEVAVEAVADSTAVEVEAVEESAEAPAADELQVAE